MADPRRVLLTPLAVADGQGCLVCIVIRDPETEEVVDTVVTSYDLAEKAGIPLEDAQRIFQAAQDVAESRLME